MLRAHRVMNVDYTKQYSFNMLHDEKLVEYLADKFDFFVMLDDDGVGFAVLPTEALQGALLNVVMVDSVRASLKKDIEFGKKSGWVRYVFFYAD